MKWLGRAADLFTASPLAGIALSAMGTVVALWIGADHLGYDFGLIKGAGNVFIGDLWFLLRPPPDLTAP